MKQQEIDELKPKARSALAARWEERIRARSDGKITREDNRATVITGKGMQVSVQYSVTMWLCRIGPP